MSDEVVTQQRVAEYENLIEATLKPLAAKYRESLLEAQKHIAEWEELASQLGAMKAHSSSSSSSTSSTSSASASSPLRMLVDVGCGYKQHARIASFAPICVNVGLDVYVEMPQDEAYLFAQKRVTHFSDIAKKAQKALEEVSVDLCVSSAALAHVTKA